MTPSYTDKPICPICGYEEQDAWEFNFGPGIEGDIEHDCRACGETYFLSRHASISYSSSLLPRAEAVEGDVNIDRMVYEGGIGPETSTSTDVSAIETKCIDFCIDHRRQFEGTAKRAAHAADGAAAELAALRSKLDGTLERLCAVLEENSALRAKAQSGYYKQLQTAKAKIEAQEEKIERFNRALCSLTPSGSEFHMDPDRCVEFVTQARAGEHKALVEAVKARMAIEATVAAQDAEIGRLRQVAQLAADMAGEDDGRALAAMARTTAIVAKEALFDFPVDPPSPTPTGKIERLQRAASRACDVMSECVEHGECAGADRAEMRAAEKALVDAILPSAPADSVLVPRERLREIADSRDCPGCGRFTRAGVEKHAPDCWVGNALAEKA